MNVRNWIVGIVSILALIGLGSFMFNNPAGLFKQLLFMGIAVAAFYVIYRIWMSKRPGGNDRRSFAKAAKLSKRRNRRAGENVRNHALKKPLRKKSAAHLTVIEGKKSKKKDRAIF
ncbi:SA1362 family protein [Lederbergia citrea]|uniref:SA1362 family protein n=1 Tax=Lederbergia citrea TaxID=2833581 RepID=UPI001BCA1CB6|nr:SA1362 family protein [Lederbergia citrea]MBS4176369.1 hypothetical protein [Lederbergia citrea]MBS4202930.1 hypothetical protein [Lederbergia citrea]